MESNVLATLDSPQHSTWHCSKANWTWHNESRRRVRAEKRSRVKREGRRGKTGGVEKEAGGRRGVEAERGTEGVAGTDGRDPDRELRGFSRSSRRGGGNDAVAVALGFAET